MQQDSLNTVTPVADDAEAGRELKRRREDVLGKRSVTRLADLVGVTRNTIMNAENGESSEALRRSMHRALDEVERRRKGRNLYVIPADEDTEITVQGRNAAHAAEIAAGVQEWLNARKDSDE